MLELPPTEWLFEQNVPLIYFLFALLTRPAFWSQMLINAVQNRIENND